VVGSTYYVQHGSVGVVRCSVASSFIRVADCTAPPMQFARHLPKCPSPLSTHFNLQGACFPDLARLRQCVVERILWPQVRGDDCNGSNDPCGSPSVSRPCMCLTRFRMGVVFRGDPCASSSPVTPSQSTSAPPVLGLSLLPAALDPSSRWNLAMVHLNHTQKDSGCTVRAVLTLAVLHLLTKNTAIGSWDVVSASPCRHSRTAQRLQQF